jgi:hypothetical protein
MKNKIEIKIVEETNPFGSISYIVLTREKYLFILPGIWHSISYYYTESFSLYSIESCYRKYDTLSEAENVVNKYLKWMEGSYKSKTITHKYLNWINGELKSKSVDV